ncbi:hypothetical protein LTR40_011560, partial [Exophiala xenobiotica]
RIRPIQIHKATLPAIRPDRRQNTQHRLQAAGLCHLIAPGGGCRGRPQRRRHCSCAGLQYNRGRCRDHRGQIGHG